MVPVVVLNSRNSSSGRSDAPEKKIMKTSRFRILFIDDDRDILEIGKKFLELTGDLSVDTSDSPGEALGMIRSGSYHAVVSDYEMPLMNGIELLKQVRQLGNQIPFIILTGRGREDVVIAALNNGADLYLQKGTDPHVQFTELGHAISRKVRMQNGEPDIRTPEQAPPSAAEPLTDADTLSRQKEPVRESEEQFQALFMNMIEGAALHDLIFDEENIPVDYIIIKANPAFETHLGISRSSVIGKTSREAYGTMTPPYLDIYARVAETGNPEVFETYFPPLDKYFSISVYRPYKGSFATIFEDITVRKRAEEALVTQYNTLVETEENLRQTKKFLEDLISVANVPIIVWDPSFRVTRMNRAFEQLIGRREDEVIGNSVESLFPPEQRDWSMQLFRSVLDGSRLETCEIPVLHRDGSLRTLLWNSSTLYALDGLTPVATIAQGRDVTGERVLEQDKSRALLQIQQNLAYLAILNDEIRNPLTIIVTYADMIEDAGVVDQIMVQAQRIDMIVNQLDQRWIESEKVLNAIRKHYHVHSEDPTGPEIPGSPVDTRRKNTGGVISRPGKNDGLLVEEVQTRLYTILDSIDALVYVADMETYEILFMNQNGRNFFGDVVGKKCYDTIQNSTEGPCPFCTNKYLKDSTGATGVYRWEFKNTRSGKWYDCRDRAIRWSDGRLVRLEIATDITGRKHSEEHLKDLTRMLAENEAKYHSLIQNSHDIIYTFNTGGIFTFVSPSWTTLLGHPVDHVIGRPFRHFIHPDDSENCIPLIEDLIAGKQHLTGVEYRVRHLDGSWRWLISNIVSIQDRSGRITGGEGSARDITDWKLAGEALQESEERYRKLVENIPDYILVHRDGIIRFVNAAAASAVGYTTGEITGTHLMRYLTPESRVVVAEMMQKRFAGRAIPPYEITFVTREGRHLTAEVNGVLIQYGGEPASLNVITDITERKRALEEVQKSEEHLRTILNALQIGIIIIDAETHVILEANQKVLDMIGADHDVVTGSPCHCFICPAEKGRCPITDLGLVVDSSERILLSVMGERIPVLKSVIKTMLSGREVLIESFINIQNSPGAGRDHKQSAGRQGGE